jgi:peptide/nickel transport system permease protein
MMPYVVRRLFQAAPVILIITIVCFAFVRMSGDPLAAFMVEGNLTSDDIARLEARLGLDQPAPVQYLNWLGQMLLGNWGTSFSTREPVQEMIFSRLPNTVLLISVSFTLTLTLAIVLGVATAVRQYSRFDHVVTTIAFIGLATPNFWLGLMLIIVFGVQFKNLGLPYLPVGGMYDLRAGPSFGQYAWHLVLPAVTLSFLMTARYIRYIRGTVLEQLNLDYVRTARGKGLHPIRVYVHVLRNSLLPLITLVALDIPGLLSGTIVIESIFTWPGMGRLFWMAAERSDMPVLMAVLLFVSVITVLANLLADVAYALVDPRIKFS